MGALVTASLAVGDKVQIKYEDPSRPGEPPRLRYATVRQRFGFRYGFEFDEQAETKATPPPGS